MMINNGNDASQCYLTEVIKRLESEGFSVNPNTVYKNQVFQYTANKTNFELGMYGFIDTFFSFATFLSIDSETLKEYSSQSFEYARKASRPPLPRGLFKSIICFPVVVVNSLEEKVSEDLLTKNPPKHWAAFEMPVVYSTSTKILHYCETTPTWGKWYYDQLRAMILAMLSPADTE